MSETGLVIVGCGNLIEQDGAYLPVDAHTRGDRMPVDLVRVVPPSPGPTATGIATAAP